MKVAKRNPVRVVIISPEGLLLDLLQRAVGDLGRTEVVGAVSEFGAALRRVEALQPDVVVLDTAVENLTDGIQLALRLRKALPELGLVLLADTRVISLLTTIPDNRLLGWTYLVDRSVHNLKTLGRAIQITAAQLLDLDGPSATASRPVRHDPRLDGRLTHRQFEVLALLSEGITNAAIADALQVTEKTVENQLTTIYNKLDIDRDRSSAHPRIKAALHYLQLMRERSPVSAAEERARGDR